MQKERVFMLPLEPYTARLPLILGFQGMQTAFHPNIPSTTPLCLRRSGHQIEYPRHLSCGSSSRRCHRFPGRIDEIPVGIIFAGITVAHLHHHQEQDSQQADADQNTVYPIGRVQH